MPDQLVIEIKAFGINDAENHTRTGVWADAKSHWHRMRRAGDIPGEPSVILVTAGVMRAERVPQARFDRLSWPADS